MAFNLRIAATAGYDLDDDKRRGEAPRIMKLLAVKVSMRNFLGWRALR